MSCKSKCNSCVACQRGPRGHHGKDGLPGPTGPQGPPGSSVTANNGLSIVSYGHPDILKIRGTEITSGIIQLGLNPLLHNTLIDLATFFMAFAGTGTFGIGTSAFNPSNPEKLLVDTGSAVPTVNAAVFRGDQSSYLQINIMNLNPGPSGSSDVVATANDGSETTKYIDMGINGSGNTSGQLGGPDDAYIYNDGGHLQIGPSNPGKNLILFAGGYDTTAYAVATILSDYPSSASGLLLNSINSGTTPTPGSAPLGVDASGNVVITTFPVVTVCHLWEETLKGIPAGAFHAGKWIPRQFNRFSGEIYTVIEGWIKLPSGRYSIVCRAPGNNCGLHQLRLIDRSQGILKYGPSIKAVDCQSIASLSHTFEVQKITEIRIEHKCNVSNGTDGLGVDDCLDDAVNIHSQLEITKLS
jgi:hypothetical protein